MDNPPHASIRAAAPEEQSFPSDVLLIASKRLKHLRRSFAQKILPEAGNVTAISAGSFHKFG